MINKSYILANIKARPRLFFLIAALIATIGGAIFFLVADPLKINDPATYAKRIPKIKIIKAAFIADIHASNNEIREKQESIGNTIYPAMYKKIFPEILEKIKNEGVETIIVLGDNTNNSSKKHAEILKQMAHEKNSEIFWIKGNHDEGEVMSTLGLDRNYYYYADKDGWRFIFLDTTEEVPNSTYYVGRISDPQIEWLEETLKTDLNVLISMHNPIWDKETRENVYPAYQEFKEIIEASGNVKFVLAGHWHAPYWQKDSNGIRYYGIPAMSLKDYPDGYYKILRLVKLEYDK